MKGQPGGLAPSGHVPDRVADVPRPAPEASRTAAPTVPLLGREIGNRILLVKVEYWIGADPSRAFRRSADPFREARHVRLHRGPR